MPQNTMSLNQAERIVGTYKYWEDISCFCTREPCLKCISQPSREDFLFQRQDWTVPE